MAITPHSTIYLMKTPFEPDYKHLAYWESISQQVNTMKGFIVHEFNTYTFQRKDGVIRVNAHIDSIIDCNYVMYKNKEVTDRWYYAFVTNMDYINDNVTHVHIKTDVYNTWWNDVTVKPSFVEREHTDDDTRGKNTFPEQLETGPYTIENKIQKGILGKDMGAPLIVIAATEAPDGSGFSGGGVYGGVYSGVRYYMYTTPQAATNALKSYDDGRADAVQCVFMAPSMLYDEATGDGYTTWDVNVNFDLNTVNGYEPRNKKLLTYPYKYLLASNNQGASNVYYYERFLDGEPIKFKFEGVITPGCSIRCYPKWYDRIAENYNEGINVGKFPICNWKSDVYTNWLTQNAVNIGVDTVGGIVNTFAGAFNGANSGALTGLAMGGPGAAVGTTIVGGVLGAANGLLQIGSTIGSIYQHSLMPDAAKGNVNCGDVVFAGGYSDISFYSMSVKNEYAKIIDDYFSMYGYKVCRVKLPNSNHRARYWFTKTIDVNIDGECPASDLTEFKGIYDNGVTFWKDIDNFGVYFTVQGGNDNPVV